MRGWQRLLCSFGDDDDPGQGGGGGGGGNDDPPAGGNKKPDPPTPQGIVLTPEQAAAVAAGQPLVLNDDQFKGGVKGRLNAYAAEKRELEAKLKQYEDETAERERKKLEEDGKLQELLVLERSEKARLQDQITELTLRSAFAAAASKANVVDVEAAYLLAKASPEWAEVKTEGGQVAGMETVVASLIEARPFLVAQTKPKTVGGQTNPDPTKKAPEEAPKTFQEARQRLNALTTQ